jgi:tetratricopeptide (TPR) repeat protein
MRVASAAATTSTAATVSAASAAIVILVLILGAFTLAAAGQRPPQSVADAVRQAQTAYEEGQPEQAAEIYRGVLAAGWGSAALYYNLGCASFRAGQIGWAVGFFEEARRLAPRDADIRHNLRIALGQKRDRLEEERPSWLLGLLAGLLDSYAPVDVVRWLVALLWVACLVAAVHWVARDRARAVTRRALPVVGALALLAAGALCLKAYQASSAPSGVIVAEEAQVLTGPRTGETVQFVLHEGTFVHLGREAGAWREVWLTEQMRGWVPRESLMALRPPRWLP